MIAYNTTWLHNLLIAKEAKRWLAQDAINQAQLDAIRTAHPSAFYHPNLFIRILLFMATLVALGGVTGLLGLLFMDALEDAIEVISLLYGIGSWFFLELVFVRNGKHYKSGVNEAMLYHSMGWTIGGLAALGNFQEQWVTIVCIVVFAFAAIRYADLISTLCAFGSFAYLIFNTLYLAGGVFQFVIPLLFIVVFTPIYFITIAMKRKETLDPWCDCLLLVESLTLLTIYAAGNYFVVRELSEKMMNLYLDPGSDIPFAPVFYALTVIIPVLYLYFGLTRKNIVLLRVSLLALAFSVFTFKYYFSLGHPEITLTLAGAVLLTVALYFFRYLRVPHHGYTRENLLKEKWASANPEAFVISQTMGGNQVSAEAGPDMGGGGKMGGGGSSDSF
jgi:hypothetical protein